MIIASADSKAIAIAIAALVSSCRSLTGFINTLCNAMHMHVPYSLFDYRLIQICIHGHIYG